MSTLSAPGDSWIETRFREDDHPEWKRAFDVGTRRSLVDDDLTAGHTISRILVTIVTIGLILTIGATLSMLRW